MLKVIMVFLHQFFKCSGTLIRALGVEIFKDGHMGNSIWGTGIEEWVLVGGGPLGMGHLEPGTWDGRLEMSIWGL